MLKIPENWLTLLVFATLLNPSAPQVGSDWVVCLQNTLMASNMILKMQKYPQAEEIYGIKYKIWPKCDENIQKLADAPTLQCQIEEVEEYEYYKGPRMHYSLFEKPCNQGVPNSWGRGLFSKNLEIIVCFITF